MYMQTAGDAAALNWVEGQFLHQITLTARLDPKGQLRFPFFHPEEALLGADWSTTFSPETLAAICKSCCITYHATNASEISDGVFEGSAI